MDKSLIRKVAIAERKALTPEQRAALSARITENALAMRELMAAKVVSAFLPLGSEVDTRTLVEKLLFLGKNVCLPVVDRSSGGLKFARLQSFEEEMVEGEYGVPEPKDKVFVNPEKIDFFFIPGIAFDRRGARLGWGEGYYDRFFGANKTNGLKVGVAFGVQVGIELPVEKHDALMDAIVTEKGVIRPK